MSDQVSQWDTFFAALTAVAITAFSILFVTLQVRSDVWQKSRFSRALAITYLTELFVPMSSALIFLMAGTPWREGSVASGLLGVLVIAWHWVVYCQDDTAKPNFERVQAWTGLVSLICYGAIVASAFLSVGLGLHLLAGVCVWLILSGTSESWLLLSGGSIFPSSPPPVP